MAEVDKQGDWTMTMRERSRRRRRYPTSARAIMPALLIAQSEHGHLPGPVLEEVADILGVERIWVYELASLPLPYRAGGHVPPAALRQRLLHAARSEDAEASGSGARIRKGGTTLGRLFTLSTVECLGACEMAL